MRGVADPGLRLLFCFCSLPIVVVVSLLLLLLLFRFCFVDVSLVIVVFACVRYGDAAAHLRVVAMRSGLHHLSCVVASFYKAGSRMQLHLLGAL